MYIFNIYIYIYFLVYIICTFHEFLLLLFYYVYFVVLSNSIFHNKEDTIGNIKPFFT